MYTPSSEYKRILNMLAKIQDLVTVLHIPTGMPPEKKECNIFYKMVLQGSFVSLEAYVVHSASPEASGMTMIVPEEAFMKKGEFWVGTPSKVFKDYSPDRDKIKGKLTWTAAFDREVVFPLFYVNLNDCLFEWKVPMSFIEKFGGEDKAEDIALRFATKALTTTIDDAFLDNPVTGTGVKPAFIKS